jgi:hypothetical protein
MAREIERRVQIHRHDAMPLLQRGLGDRLVRADSGIADQNVDGAELRGPAGDHGLDGGRIRDVGQRADDPHARLAAVGGHRLELVSVHARVEHEVGALGGERERDRPPDVAAGARDEGRLAPQPHLYLMTVPLTVVM